MNQLTRNAYAKINLGLDVLRKRPDGYHELAMVMQTVDICDELTFVVRDEPGIELTVEWSMDGWTKEALEELPKPGESQPVPADRSNLVWRAAEMLMSEFSVQKGVSIHLVKKIPVAAGMAGGSSDCAATLWGINELFGLGLTGEELQARGVKLGADVPYCVLGGTALAEGIGEILTPLTPMPKCSLVVAKPAVGISTPFVFKQLRLEALREHPDIYGMCEAIKTGDLDGVVERFGNVLETAAIPHYPIVGELKEALAELGAKGVLMSGSGPTVFAVFASEEEAKKAARELTEKALAAQIFVTRPV
ncbi:MAG: 4-(cytidine 5'-diphospho)-2-C-methyl-D-erythritol kinase [Lachnospiraceae bacterium]|nr:4-(cytidine 5'-diphospho)-2-C-methyl-D-erythritol kinase [Lachnospiraceae bacterium]